MLHAHLVSDKSVVNRFEQEAKTSTLLRHPNIVNVRGSGRTENGQPYLIMDYVEGHTLQDVLKSGASMPIERALPIFVQICCALSLAHENGIVHRDLKPGNIMLTPTADGSVKIKVLDFGIAKILPPNGETVFKLTQTGETLGSLLYMSPEQCLDQDLTHAFVSVLDVALLGAAILHFAFLDFAFCQLTNVQSRAFDITIVDTTLADTTVRHATSLYLGISHSAVTNRRIHSSAIAETAIF